MHVGQTLHFDYQQSKFESGEPWFSLNQFKFHERGLCLICVDMISKIKNPVQFTRFYYCDYESQPESKLLINEEKIGGRSQRKLQSM